jgi:tetrahydromethanopterin S-methyltransferase subunit G
MDYVILCGYPLVISQHVTGIKAETWSARGKKTGRGSVVVFGLVFGMEVKG